MVDINVGPVIYVDRGYFTTHMPIYQNFKKKHINTLWGDIMIILDEIEEFCQIYSSINNNNNNNNNNIL